MMPSSSKKQADFMRAVAHSPSFAKKVEVPQSVGKDFSTADKGRKFSKGGDMKKMNMGGYADGGMTMVNKGGKMVPDFAADGVGKMAKGGAVGMHKMPDGKMMKDSAMTKMAKGGMAEGGKADMAQDKAMIKKAFKQHDMQEHKGGKGTSLKLAKGGGIESRGKTKGTMITMKSGGRAC
jgi:hypothetical protein